MSTPQPFLSDAWIDNAQALKAEFDGEAPPSALGVRMNVVVTDIPHRDDDLDGHIDTSKSEVIIERGHLDDPDLTLTVDYATAKAAFVTRDQQAVMQAFFSGKILVDGDASKLLALQAQPPNERAVEMYQRLSALTSDD